MNELDALIATVPYYRYLGLRPGPDLSVVMACTDLHASDAPAVHGGVLSAFLEATATLYLQHTGAPRARASDLTTAFLRPASLSDTTARARPIRQGRRFAHLEITAWQSDPSRPVAVAHGTWVLEP